MPTQKRVLLVDDDAMLRASIGEQLAQEGFVIAEAGSCAQGLERASEGLYEFMILDVGLPDGDGRTLCRSLRAAGITCPIRC